jgi:glycosyltransferase involved in cell wall biosynthesis
VDASLDQREGIRDARECCRNVVTVPDTQIGVGGRRKRFLQARSMLSVDSYERHLFRRPAFQRALDEHLREHDYDVVNSEFMFMADYRFRFRNAARTRLALDEHNVEYDILRRTASATSLDRRVFNAVNWRKLRREELAAWARVDGCTLTSHRDEEIVRRESPRTKTAVVPNGVDVESFQPRPESAGGPPTILFFGAINYFPNTDGVAYFLDAIWPILASRHPELRVRIVGPGAPDSIRDRASARVAIPGFVEDLPAEIAGAAVVVAPLRIGGGTRLKILEAMAMGRPIVSTAVGAEGLNVTHDRDILLADAPRAFADAVSRILADRALGERLGSAARLLAESSYGWRAAAAKLESFYEELLATSGARSGPHTRRGPGSSLRSMTG